MSHQIVGQRFTRLIVQSQAGKRATCLCDCGKTKTVYVYNLKSGATRSCGCLHREELVLRASTHGKSKSSLYRVWTNMRSRCHDKSNKEYRNYGARGIYVCDRWRHDFAAFLSDMGPRPKGYLLERVNNDLGYSPDNCAWASLDQQANNRRTNRVLSVNGTSMTAKQWSRLTGVNYGTLMWRLENGVSPEAALSLSRMRRRWKKDPEASQTRSEISRRVATQMWAKRKAKESQQHPSPAA